MLFGAVNGPLVFCFSSAAAPTSQRIERVRVLVLKIATWRLAEFRREAVLIEPVGVARRLARPRLVRDARRAPVARGLRGSARDQGGSATRSVAGSGIRSGITKPLWSHRSNVGGRIERSKDLFHRSRRNQRQASVCRGCWCCGLLGNRRTQAAIASMWNAARRAHGSWLAVPARRNRALTRCLVCLLSAVLGDCYSSYLARQLCRNCVRPR